MFPAGRPPHDKAGWAATVDRMNARWPARDPKTEPLLLPPKDRDIVVDYLAEHFGVDSEPRVLQLSSEAELDLKVLEKAQIMEYIYHEDPEKYPEHFPWSHNVAFGPDGNVWIAYRACCIVRFDPRTGEQKVFEGNGGGSGIIVDHLDGTVWYSGQGAQKNNGGFAPGVQQFASVRHLDPETGLVDTWLGQYTIGLVFDSQANLWMSGIKKWDRKTNTMKRWGVPVIRTGGYGTVIDSQDRLWFGEHYLGGVTLFDPKTETFTNYQLTEKLPSNTRRPGIDSKDMIWMGDWAHPNRRQANGRDKGGTLHRLNPETGEVWRREMGIEYSAPYDTDVDPDDNIWVTNDNYLTKYDQKADTFTHYPVVRRSDTLKTSITRDGAIWFVMRNASKYSGTGGMAAVLYTDKDKIKTLGAYYEEGSDHYRYYDYSGPMPPKVTGTVKASGQIRYSEPLQNAEEYEKWVIDNASQDSGYN